MPRKKAESQPAEATVQIGIRVPLSLAAAIDDYLKIIKAQVPGFEPSRSDAARALILLGLEATAKRRAPR